MISLVPNEYLHLVWDKARDHLVHFEKRSGGKYSVDDIGKMISDEIQQLWIIADDDHEVVGAVVTQVWETPQKKICDVVACAGDGLDDYLYESMKELENFARLNHCDAMRVEGRNGWLKVLEPYGFGKTSIVMEKEL